MRHDCVVIGAGLGGLTAAAILACAGRSVLVLERSNSVGGAASSYKVGDLFVEGSLHETGDPFDPADPKHDALARAGVRDAVTWVPSGDVYQTRGGPLGAPFTLPAGFDAAEAALVQRFPHHRNAIALYLNALRAPAADNDAVSLAQKLDALFGADEAIKCAVVANLAYYHDDPRTLAWSHFAHAQARLIADGGRYVQGGSQRLSSALARAVKKAGGLVAVRRVVTAVARDGDGWTVTHTAKDGSDAATASAVRAIGNAAPAMLAALLPPDDGARLRDSYAGQQPAISLFALTLGLSRPPRAFGLTHYATQLLPSWMTSLADYARGTRLMAEEPGDAVPPLALADYSAIDSGVPAPPHVLSVFGPDHLVNWDASDIDAYRQKRGRWQDAIVAALDREFPGLADAVVASSFNTALSVRQYLNAADGAVYGFAPSPGAPPRSPLTVLPRFYLASAYAGQGGYSGVIAAAAACADLVIAEG